MRTLKFRAWHEGANEMLYPENDRQDHVFFWKHEGQPVVIEQFTGLLDKNGKEIYEGDIVKIVYVPIGSYPTVFEYFYIGIIVWGYKEFAVQKKISGGTILDDSRKLSHHRDYRDVYKHPTAGMDWIDKSQYFDRVEVIGNIHQNPDLL